AAGEPAIAIRRPLHWRAYAVAVAEIDVVAHADLVAIIDDRRPWKRHQERIHELDLAPIIVHQGGQTPPDAEIDAGAGVRRIGRPQVIALDVGHHLERELVVIAQK